MIFESKEWKKEIMEGREEQSREGARGQGGKVARKGGSRKEERRKQKRKGGNKRRRERKREGRKGETIKLNLKLTTGVQYILTYTFCNSTGKDGS